MRACDSRLPTFGPCRPRGYLHAPSDSAVIMQHIIRGLEAVEAIPGRCEIIDEGQEFGVVVDSASDPRCSPAFHAECLSLG